MDKKKEINDRHINDIVSHFSDAKRDLYLE